MKIKCVIIEDDPLSLHLLEDLIRKISVLNLIGKYSSAKEAFLDMENLKNAELIFLDIEMPDLTGMEFLENLQETPEVVIITGNPEYAVDAFEKYVTDYILKPVSLPRLLKAVNKVKENIEKKENKKEGFNNENNIFIKTDKGILNFKINDIFYLEAMENYVKIHTYDNVHISHSTMKKMLEILPSIFFQVHRSFIINLNHISLIQSNVIVIKTNKGNKTIPIGKKYKEYLFKRLNIT